MPFWQSDAERVASRKFELSRHRRERTVLFDLERFGEGLAEDAERGRQQQLFTVRGRFEVAGQSEALNPDLTRIRAGVDEEVELDESNPPLLPPCKQGGKIAFPPYGVGGE